jgi:putative inorganic carbon (HCO3(-)) transporter
VNAHDELSFSSGVPPGAQMPVEYAAEGQKDYEAGSRSWKSSGSRMTLAYAGVFAFIVVYFVAPALWVPGLRGIPFAKITGAIALVAFVLGYLSSETRQLPRETKVLLLLFLQLCLSLPFAYWRTGSIKMVLPFDGFFGITVMTIAVTFAVTSLRRLLRLVFIQTAALTIFAVIAIAGNAYQVNPAGDRRLVGVANGLFINSNDFALGMVMVLPFCFLFLYNTRSIIKKLIWAAAIGVLAFGIMSTYSRGGFLALVAVLSVCLWDFALKRRRFALPLLLVVAFAVLVVASPDYQERLLSIVTPKLDTTGSRDQRTFLLKRSVAVTLQHPIFGVGPGNFEVLSGIWHVAHNNYTQLSAEAGIPALIFFLLLLGYTFSTLRRVERSCSLKYQMTAVGLRASLIAFVANGLFISNIYSFGPFFLFAYAAALGRMADSEEAKTDMGFNIGTSGAETLHPLDDNLQQCLKS